MLSNSQIDRLGEKLRAGSIDAECLRGLEGFRASHAVAYGYVEQILSDKLRHVLTGRPSKSTVAIVEKLRRESVRLSQIQDIAGCRLLVEDIEAQDDFVKVATVMLGDVKVDDKREKPTNGYRAVHLIVRHSRKCVEVQVRTRMQHNWAEFSEKMADRYGQGLKYGLGEAWAVDFLLKLSELTAELERIQVKRFTNIHDKSRRGKSIELIRGGKTLNKQAKQLISDIKNLFLVTSERYGL